MSDPAPHASGSRARADIVLDADNLPAHRVEIVAQLAEDVREHNLSVRTVHIVGRHQGAIAPFKVALENAFPGVTVSEARAWPATNAADMLAAFWLGRLSAERGVDVSTLYVLSYDKLVLRLAREALGDSFHLVVPLGSGADEQELGRGLPLPKATTSTRPSRVEVDLPAWAENLPTPGSGVALWWLGPEVAEAPPFVPIPDAERRVLIGGGEPSVDLSLDYWDARTGPGSLYSPHAVLEYARYPKSFWTIRSASGHRTGRKKTALNGKLLSARSGRYRLASGDVIDLGPFTFRFEDHPIVNFATREDPKVLIEAIERRCRDIAERLDPDLVPEAVREDLADGGGLDWSLAYVRHYAKTFAGIHGQSGVPFIDAAFSSRTKLRKVFGSLNRIRNVAFHPSRGVVSTEDREKLASMYVDYFRDATREKNVSP